LNRQVGVGKILHQGIAEEMLGKGFPPRGLHLREARVCRRKDRGRYVFFTQRSQQCRPVRLTVDLINLFSHDPNKLISTRCLEADHFHADLIEDQQGLKMHTRSKLLRGTALPSDGPGPKHQLTRMRKRGDYSV
jgi:hypothetical protein